MMGRAVRSGNAAPVHGENDGEFLKADILEEIVKRALKKSRVDRTDDLHLLSISNPAAKGHRMPFRNTYIQASFRKPVHKFFQTRAGWHRRGACNEAGVIFSHF